MILHANILSIIKYNIIMICNTYPTTPEQLYKQQQIRDMNNPGCIAFRESEAICKKNIKTVKKTKEQIKLLEEKTKKWDLDQIAGYASRRFDFPQYHWWMIQDGKKYLRSSKNFNVYDYAKSSVIVGTWNEETQRIEFNNDLSKRILELEQMVTV